MTKTSADNSKSPATCSARSRPGWVTAGVLMVGLLFPSIVQADQWSYFFPEAVTTYGCSVAPAVMMGGRDANESHEAYIAEAHAERQAQLGRWSMTVATEPLTHKGRRKALKACAAWMDEAEKRITAAAPIKVRKNP